MEAQQGVFEQALAKIKIGRKRSHWMWFIFPQFTGLGFSPTSQMYAIKSVAEARAYLDHPILGPRLIECADAVLNVQGKTAIEIFGSPDDMKRKSWSLRCLRKWRRQRRCSTGSSMSAFKGGATTKRSSYWAIRRIEDSPITRQESRKPFNVHIAASPEVDCAGR